jgi:hypothetical protein
MNNKTAEDLMVPLDEYPVVDISATVQDAVIKLEEARQKMEAGRQPFQAVLIADESGRIVGKIGQMALLKALEPSRRTIFDQDALDKAGVSDTVIETALDHMRTFQCDFSEMCEGVSLLPVRKVMHPVKEHIDIGGSINEVIHSLVRWQTLSVLVTENGRPVGLARLSDLCDAVIAEIRRGDSGSGSED